MQQWGWVGSAAAPSCAVGTGVLDSVLLLPPCTPGLWLQVNGKWHSHAGKICGALASEGGKGSLSQFLLKGWGRGSCAVMQVGGGGGVRLPGVQRISLAPCGKVQGLAPFLPACPGGCWLPHGATGAPVARPGPSALPGEQSVPQHWGTAPVG